MLSLFAFAILHFLASCANTPGCSCLVCRWAFSSSLLAGSNLAVARCIYSCPSTPGCSRLVCRCSFSFSLFAGSNLAVACCDVLLDCSSSLLVGSPHMVCRCSFFSYLLAGSNFAIARCNTDGHQRTPTDTEGH